MRHLKSVQLHINTFIHAMASAHGTTIDCFAVLSLPPSLKLLVAFSLLQHLHGHNIDLA